MFALDAVPVLGKRIYAHEKDLKLTYYKNFMSPRQSELLFDALEEQVEYLGEEYSVLYRGGEPAKIPRKHVAYGDDESLTYKFSKLELPTKKWTPLLENVRDYVYKITDIKFNYVLLNRYEDGRNSIGFHSDDEAMLDAQAPIVTLSLGATRKFVVKHAHFQKISFSLPLKSGSLLCMDSKTNETYVHSIPKDTKVQDPRISLTFRKILRPNEIFC